MSDADLFTHSSSFPVSPPSAASPDGPDKNSTCFCGVTLLRSVFWARNPVFVKQLHPLPFPSHAPSGHSSVFSCGSVQLGSRKGKFWLAVNCLSWNCGRRFLKGQLSMTQGKETLCDCLGSSRGEEAQLEAEERRL